MVIPEGTWDGSDLFRSDGRDTRLVTDRARQALLDGGVGGLLFTPLADVEVYVPAACAATIAGGLRARTQPRRAGAHARLSGGGGIRTPEPLARANGFLRSSLGRPGFGFRKPFYARPPQMRGQGLGQSAGG
jgi:hypothetical protein